MFGIIGLVVVIVMIFGTYVIIGGNIMVVIEALAAEGPIILGGAFGAYMIANSPAVAKAGLAGIAKSMKGPKWSQDDYKELLGLMFVLMKTMRSKGVVAIEGHIENPEESKIFSHFGKITDDHHIVDFIADYMRMMTMNFEDPMQMEDAMNADIERIHEDEHEPQHALGNMAEGLPAIGIVAAVLGIVKPMGNITAPVEV